jgi:predicted GNAT family acetyltransferase
MTMTGSLASAVRDNPERHRFELDLGDGFAVANYRLSSGVVTIFHTEVPVRYQGQGIAAQLVTGALDLIRQRGQKVVSRCGYLTAFLQRHPQYGDLIG